MHALSGCVTLIVQKFTEKKLYKFINIIHYGNCIYLFNSAIRTFSWKMWWIWELDSNKVQNHIKTFDKVKWFKKELKSFLLKHEFVVCTQYTRTSTCDFIHVTRFNGLFNNSVSTSDYIVSDKWWIGKWIMNWKGCVRKQSWPH